VRVIFVGALATVSRSFDNAMEDEKDEKFFLRYKKLVC